MPRGRHKHLTSSYELIQEGQNPHRMTADGWGDTTWETFISNVSNTLPSSPANCPRCKLVMRNVEVVSEQELINIPRPTSVEFIINYFSIIGGHNYLRQGSLAMGNRNTRHWILTTLIEVIFTNALCAYCVEYRSVNCSDITYLDTYSKLAKKIDLQHLYSIWTWYTQRRHIRNEGKVKHVSIWRFYTRINKRNHYCIIINSYFSQETNIH